MEILIALDLPKKIDKLVDEKRAIYYPRILGRLEPHLTLKEPARVLGDFKLIEEKLAKITSEHQPIKIKVDGIGHFGQRVIFWKIAPNQDLINLNQKIEKALAGHLSSKDNRHQLTPHITILSRAKKAQFKEVITVLKKEKYQPQYEFTADTLMILKNLDNQPGWEKIRMMKLGKNIKP